MQPVAGRAVARIREARWRRTAAAMCSRYAAQNRGFSSHREHGGARVVHRWCHLADLPYGEARTAVRNPGGVALGLLLRRGRRGRTVAGAVRLVVRGLARGG